MAKKAKSIPYFTKDTELAIMEYNHSTDFEHRSRLYRDKIHYAFFKLTENIIHTFKFYHTEVENIEDLQHEVITFLLSKIHLFDPSKGAKAYSYFGTIAKRYLIFNNTKNYKKKIEHIDIDTFNFDGDNEGNFSKSLSNDLQYDIEILEEKGNSLDKLSRFMDKYLKYCDDNLFKLFPKEEDYKVADAILELFRKRENLDIFNKKALYIYIREMVEVKTSHITKISKKLHDIFKNGYCFYIENGYVKF
jgi:hypothetical protein